MNVVITWDWKEQPPLGTIGKAVTAMSANGQVFLTEIDDTGGDLYALIVSDVELTQEQAATYFEASYD
jgi:CYTH domain-containing protein